MPTLKAGVEMWPGLLVVPYNGKIADITHADINRHTLDLEAALTETRKIISVIISANRIVGTGNFKCYPNEGASGTDTNSVVYPRATTIIADGTQRLEYSLTVANDDFDVYCLGYTVEAQT